MATTYGKVSGSYQTVVDPQAKVSGSWLSVQQAYGKVSGVWQTVYLRGFAFSQTISSDTPNYNLSSAASAAGWNGTDPLLATVTVNSGVVVGSSSTGAYAFTIPSLPAGSTVALTNNGYIVGAGGNATGFGGAAGGPALSVAFATTINNASGTVGGGGGGGGVGGPGGPIGGGGGGAGSIAGTSAGSGSPGHQGSDGSLISGGSAGSGGDGGDDNFGGDGGDGGGLGDAGSSGGGGSLGGGMAGGAAGACTNGNSNIVWINTGTRLGTLG